MGGCWSCSPAWTLIPWPSAGSCTVPQPPAYWTASGFLVLPHSHQGGGKSLQSAQMLHTGEVKFLKSHTCSDISKDKQPDVFASINIMHNGIFNFRDNANYQFRNSKQLVIPQINSTQSKSCIIYHGVFIWNNLPIAIKELNNINIFKRRLKTHLLSCYWLF